MVVTVLLSVISQFYKINENCENTLATIKIEFTFVYRIPGHGRLLLANAMLGVKSGSFEIFGGLLKFISSLCLV